MEITKKDLENQTEEIQKYNNILYEKFRQDIRIIGEGWQGIAKKVDRLATKIDGTDKKLDNVSIKVNATFEMMGETREDIEIMKIDISFIKNALKQKADKDELEALEKRVLFLENKLKRA